jgi:predicted naringenin-chalcone synthase
MATGNPRYKVTQKEALAVALKAPGCSSVRNVLERIYGNSRIATRYLAVPDFCPAQKADDDEFFYPEDGSFSVPVQKRLDKYRELV